jgi:hypothetical protein
VALVEHAERELRAAGWFNDSPDSPYFGMLGPDVLELVKVFAAQGHSGGSAHLAIKLFCRVASWKTLAPLLDPMITKEYMEVHEKTLQSTRRSSVFSEDGGKKWYDIDKPIPWWKQWMGVRRFYISFPYAG